MLRRSLAAANATSANVTVSGSPKWDDTKMDVTAGDKLHITATGTVSMGKDTGITPAGAPARVGGHACVR